MTTTKRVDELKVGDVIKLSSWCLGVIREIRRDSGRAIGIVFAEIYREGILAGQGDKNRYFESRGIRAAYPGELFEVLTP